MKKEATASEDIQDAANALMNHLDKKKKETICDDVITTSMKKTLD